MLHGIAVSNGIGLGTVMLLKEQELSYDEAVVADEGMEAERLLMAVERFCAATARQVEQLRRAAGFADAQILETHIDMVRDPVLFEEMREQISEGSRAETALKEVCGKYIDLFSHAHDELTRLRAEDIRDVCNALLCLLLGVDHTGIGAIPKGTVLVARELTPSVVSGIVAENMAENVAGIVAERGGAVSHACILARTMGVPTVCGVAGAMEKLAAGAFVIVDGSKGEVICAPEEPVIADYRRKSQAYQEERSRAEYFKDRKTLSADGREYALYCNISMPSVAAGVLEAGGEGVGLFRTEYLFMNRQHPPDEEEQFAAYSQVLHGTAGRPATIRTLDIGGDKELPCLDCQSEENPFLGLRGLRWCLKHQDVFMTQLRALLRAGAGQNLRIMLPMVSTLSELRASRALLIQAREQLMGEGKPYAQRLKLGVMVETPAAVALADRLCREVDFISIGTNDLTGYLMACDRGNAQVAGLYSPLQPAVLRALRHVIGRSAAAGVPATICGEAASDPRLIPLLMAFGISGFSVPTSSVLTVRQAISRWSLPQARQLAAAALDLDTLEEVEALLSAQTEA